jgi:hypothetical protein
MTQGRADDERSLWSPSDPVHRGASDDPAGPAPSDPDKRPRSSRAGSAEWSREREPSRETGGTVIDVLKVAVIVLLVVLVVLLGIPLGMPMSGASMCPECGPAGTSVALCAALLASVVLLLQRRATRILVDASRRPIMVAADVLERPPRLSS